MEAFLLIIGVMIPPAVSIPKVNGLTFITTAWLIDGSLTPVKIAA